MRPPILALFALLSFCSCASLQAQNTPDLKGFVTEPGTPLVFEVNGVHVTCSSSTIVKAASSVAISGGQCPQRIYGEQLAIYGKLEKKSNSMAATEIDVLDSLRDSVDGFAVIDRVLAPTVLRADGFALQSTAATQVQWKLPLTATSTPAVSQWVEYHGKFGEKGAVIVSSLTYHASEFTPREEKLRGKNEFDPKAVTDEDKQGFGSKLIKGTDYKRIPAVHDVVQQERLDRIGRRLTPAYQRELSDTDPEKLSFRFQLVDSKWSATALPSGIILVAAKVPARLNDDELAAVPAQSMVVALKKQTFRFIPKDHALTATNLAGTAADFFVPFLGLATSLGTGVAGSKMERQLEEQCGRMSMVLLNDAGFDLRQAPIAWWRLSTKQADFMKKQPPQHSAYLFKVLATMWNPDSPLTARPLADTSTPRQAQSVTSRGAK